MERSCHGKHKMVRCKICAKSVRSDHIKRHQRTHKDFHSMSKDEAREELRARYEAGVKREEKRQQIEEIAREEGIPLTYYTNVAPSSSVALTDIELEDFLLQNARVYRNSVELGKKVAAVLDKGVVPEESLPKEHKDALDLYRKQKPCMNLQTVHLRQWQQQLVDVIKPSQRNVVWVSGCKGNEGKSWFQEYITTLYGYPRVVRLDICNKTSNILYALSRRPLQTTDVFLFNDVRSQDNVNYRVLESIKDGCATASKYGSHVITFKKPNIVIVFSNRQPIRSYLSDDRWQEYHITPTGCLQKK